MPPVLAVAGVFTAIGSAITAIGTVVAISATLATIATVLTVAGIALAAISYLTMKTPKPDSSGQQLDLKLDPKSPVPIVFGRTACGGYLAYRETWGADNVNLAMAIVLGLGGPIQGFHEHWVDDRAATYSGNPETTLSTLTNVADLASDSKLFKNKTKLRILKGDAPSSTTINTAGGGGLPYSPGKISGAATAVLKFEYDQDAFAQGLPESKFILSGNKLYDPRLDSTYSGGSGSQRSDDPSTWTFSENPYLMALQWVMGRYENGFKVYGIGAAADEIDFPAFVEGANIADANGWKAGGQVTTTDSKFAVLSTILQSGGGRPLVRGAQISCLVNTPKTSAVTITEEDLIDKVEIQTTGSWRDRKNTIIPRYREENSLWEIVEADELKVQEYIDQDGGELRESELEMPFVQQKQQAEQLGLYELTNMREFLTINLVTKPLFLDVRVGDAVTVDLPSYSIVGQKCTVTARNYDPSSFQVALSLKSETDSKHDFALGRTATPPTPPALGSFDQTQISTPAASSWSASQESISDANNNRVAAVKVERTNDISALAQEIVIDTRKSGETVWKQYGVFTRDFDEASITGVESETSYEISIRYRTSRGSLSDRLVLTATSGVAAAGVVADSGGVAGVVGDFAFLNDIALDDSRITGTVNPYTQIEGTTPDQHGWSADGRLTTRSISNVAMTANAYRILASDGGEYYTVRSNIRYDGGMQISGTLPVHEAAHYHGPAIGFTDRETIAANNTEFNYLEYSFVTRYLNAGSGDIQVRDDGNVITVESGLSMADFDSRAFQIRYDGGLMEWLLDDVVVHSRNVGTGLNIWAMLSAREVGTGFEALTLSPYGAGAKVSGTNSVLEPDSPNVLAYGNVIKKAPVALSSYDSATSPVSYYRGAVISGQVNSNLSSLGFVDDPNAGATGSNLWFGIFYVNGSALIESPNGRTTLTEANYPFGGEWRFEYTGVEGRAFYNNVLVLSETMPANMTLWGRGGVFAANHELTNVHFSAGQNEAWENLSGAGKPQDNADRTVENTAAGILNQGALAVKNVVEAGDVSLQIGGANLAPDGSFEEGLGTFTQTSGVTAEQSSALALDGGNSMKVTASSTGEATIHNYFAAAIATGLNIEGPLTASIYINPPTAMQVKFRLIGTENGSSNFVTDDTADAVTPTLPANTWTRVVAQLPAFANRNGYHIRVGAFGSVTAGDFFYADNFQVEQGDVLTEYKPHVVENATKGADFTTDVTNVPSELTDGRITAGLDSSGDVVRNLPTAIKSQITLDEVSDGTTNRFYTDVEKSKLTGVETGATVGADLLTNVSNKSLANLDGAADTKLTGIETGATAGADFAANVSNVPTELTDGRITAGLNSSGDVVRNLPTAIKSQITLDEVSDGTTNRFYTATEKSKLTSVEENATLGAVWGSNITNEPAALSDINSTEGTKLSGVEDNADVSADISGPSASNFKYSSSGVAESGEFSRDFSYDLTLAGSKQTSGNTWTYIILSGSVNGFNASSTVRSMSGSGTGTLTVSSLGSDTAVVEINAVNGSKNAPAHKLTLTRSYAAPNNNGSSGGSTETASQTSGFTSFSSTAFTVVSNALSITAGTSSLEASVAMSVNPPAIGAWTIQAKLQRKISGTWTDFGTARSSVAEREVEPNFVFEYPATFNFTETATITASTTQEVRVLMRYSAGGSNTFNTSGTFEIEG